MKGMCASAIFLSMNNAIRHASPLWAALVVATLCGGCGIYTFSGSSLPSHLKTVHIPLFANQTLEPGLAESATEQVSSEILSSGVLRPAAASGDATLEGTVVGYSNVEYEFDIRGEREVDVSEYMVKVTVNVRFVDNHDDDVLYEGAITGQGIYQFNAESEADGRRRAVEDVVRQILENSVQSW